MWFSFGVFPKKWQIDKQEVLIREGAERVKGAQSFFRISWGEWKGRLFGTKDYLWKMLSLFLPCLKAKICNLSKTARVSSHAERNKCHVFFINNYFKLFAFKFKLRINIFHLSNFVKILRIIKETHRGSKPSSKTQATTKIINMDIWFG